MKNNNEFQPPADLAELDRLMRDIDGGKNLFASLSDEQRTQLKRALAERWIAEYLDDYTGPGDPKQAAQEYRAIQSGEKYPHLPVEVRNDLLMQLDEQHAEGGGPEHWTERA
jgi:hypothetical protein